MTTLLRTFAPNARLRRRAWLRGAASALDLRGDTRRQYWYGATPAEVDGDAIRNDWSQVGHDLGDAVASYTARR